MIGNVKRFRLCNIDDFSLYQQYKILECFLEEDDRILFHRYDTKISEINPRTLEKLKNEIFEDFCDDILFFQYNNKEKLTSNILNILSFCRDKYYCEETAEVLYSRLLTQDEEVLKWEEIDKIKFMIFDMFNYKNVDKDEKIWIEERTEISNKFYLDMNGMKRSNCSSIWYCQKNSEEVIMSMKRDIFYECIILKKEANFSSYSYALQYCETADSYELIIFDKCKCFLEKVLPKLIKFDRRVVELLKE